MKNLIFLILFLFSSSLFIPLQASELTASSNKAVAASKTVVDEYIYVRVQIAGVWWIIVYTLDNQFVVMFPDEDP